MRPHEVRIAYLQMGMVTVMLVWVWSCFSFGFWTPFPTIGDAIRWHAHLTRDNPVAGVTVGLIALTNGVGLWSLGWYMLAEWLNR